MSSRTRGSAYKASPIVDGNFNIGGSGLIEIYDGDAGWHGGEGGHRWTKSLASIPVPNGYFGVKIGYANWLNVQKGVRFTAGSKTIEKLLKPGEVGHTELQLDTQVRRLVIETKTNRPSDFSKSADDRELGLAITKIQYFNPIE